MIFESVLLRSDQNFALLLGFFLREFHVAFDSSSPASRPIHFVCGLAQSVYAGNGLGAAVWRCRQ